MISVYMKNGSTYRVAVQNQPKIAHKINRLIQKYPADVRFSYKEEAFFDFGESLREAVANLIGAKYFDYKRVKFETDEDTPSLPLGTQAERL